MQLHAARIRQVVTDSGWQRERRREETMAALLRDIDRRDLPVALIDAAIHRTIGPAFWQRSAEEQRAALVELIRQEGL